MLGGEQLRRVMDSTLSVDAVTDRAVEHVIAEPAVERLRQGCHRLRRLGGDLHPIGDCTCAGPDQAAVHFHHARVARLNRTELRVVADVRD